MTSIRQGWLRFGAAIRAGVLGVAAFGGASAVAQESAAKPFLENARAATAKGFFVDALAAHAEAIAAAPADADVYARRAGLFVSLSHTELAAEDYRKAVALSPEDAGLQANLCWNLAQSNRDLDGALAACNTAVRLEPGNYDALSKRGYVQLKRAAYDEAEKDFSAALALNPAAPNEMFGHGLALIHLGRGQLGRDVIASATLDSASLVGEWAGRGFGLRGDILSGRTPTTAREPTLSLNETKVFTNRGIEAHVGIKGGCGRFVPPKPSAQWAPVVADNAGLGWSGECRFGMIHGEGKLAKAGEDAAVVRYVYGREVAADEAGTALERKLTLAYRPLEEALSP